MSIPDVARLHLRRPHVNPWFVAVIVSAVLVALGAWVILDRETSTPEGLASNEVATMLNDRMAAANGGDWETFAGFYTKDAVLEERDVVPAAVTKGREVIAARVEGLQSLGLRLVSESAPIQFGRFVAQAASWGGEQEGGILVYELDRNDKIAHQWVVGGSP